MKCPVCLNTVHFDVDSAACESGHDFTMKNGVYQILDPEQKKKLETYLEAFEDFRKKEIAKMDVSQFKMLPFVDFDRDHYRLKQYDLHLIRQHATKNGKALDVGSWNGWLSNRLVELGYSTTAVDRFTHHIDGMGAKQYYPNDWTTIQLDMDRLALLDEKFDLIVVNRCLNYFTDIRQTLRDLKSLLNPGGILILTGLSYVKNPARIIEHLNSFEKEFEERYHVPFRLNAYRGFLDRNDIDLIQAEGVHLKKYPELRFKTFLATLFPGKTKYYYGIHIDQSPTNSPGTHV